MSALGIESHITLAFIIKYLVLERSLQATVFLMNFYLWYVITVFVFNVINWLCVCLGLDGNDHLDGEGQGVSWRCCNSLYAERPGPGLWPFKWKSLTVATASLADNRDFGPRGSSSWLCLKVSSNYTLPSMHMSFYKWNQLPAPSLSTEFLICVRDLFVQSFVLTCLIKSCKVGISATPAKVLMCVCTLWGLGFGVCQSLTSWRCDLFP